MSSNNKDFQSASAEKNGGGFDLSWDDFDSETDNDEIIGNAVAADVPKACSIDNPDCESCQ